MSRRGGWSKISNMRTKDLEDSSKIGLPCMETGVAQKQNSLQMKKWRDKKQNLDWQVRRGKRKNRVKRMIRRKFHLKIKKKQIQRRMMTIKDNLIMQ